MPAPIIGETSPYKLAHSLRELWGLTQNLPSSVAGVDGEVTTLQGLVQQLVNDVAALQESTGLPPGFCSIRVSQGTDTAHDVTFSAGKARSADDADNIVLSSGITKQIDAAWALGDDAGGLDTGSVGNNSIYYLWVIKRSDTGVVDALLSLSATAPTMPADYDLAQRVGWVRTDGSANILAFVQDETDLAEFRYSTVVEDVDVSNQGDSSVLRTLSLPPNSKALFRMMVNSAGASVVVRPLTENDASPDDAAVPGSSLISDGVAVAAEFEVALDASARLATRSSAGNTDLAIWTKGAKLRTITP